MILLLLNTGDSLVGLLSVIAILYYCEHAMINHLMEDTTVVSELCAFLSDNKDYLVYCLLLTCDVAWSFEAYDLLKSCDVMSKCFVILVDVHMEFMMQFYICA
ncbi:hypothetical protein ACJX0J_023801 [Zea mays]